MSIMSAEYWLYKRYTAYSKELRPISFLESHIFRTTIIFSFDDVALRWVAFVYYYNYAFTSSGSDTVNPIVSCPPDNEAIDIGTFHDAKSGRERRVYCTVVVHENKEKKRID